MLSNSSSPEFRKRLNELSLKDRRFEIFSYEFKLIEFLNGNKRLQNMIMTNPIGIFTDPDFLSFINRTENSVIKSRLDMMSPDSNQEAAFRCYNAFYNNNTNQSIQNIRARIEPLEKEINPLQIKANELSSQITQLQNVLNPIQNKLTSLRNSLIESNNQINNLTSQNNKDLQNLNIMRNQGNIPKLFNGGLPLSSIAEYCKRTNNYSGVVTTKYPIQL